MAISETERAELIRRAERLAGRVHAVGGLLAAGLDFRANVEAADLLQDAAALRDTLQQDTADNP